MLALLFPSGLKFWSMGASEIIMNMRHFICTTEYFVVCTCVQGDVYNAGRYLIYLLRPTYFKFYNHINIKYNLEIVGT